MSEESFDGFVIPGGNKVSIDDADRLIPMAEARLKDRKEFLCFLMSLARECFDMGKFAGAEAYLVKTYELTDSNDEKAFCLLSIGQMKERQGDYESALGWYRKALCMEPEGNEVWYLLHNNLGYCLNYFKRHEEALEHCKVAIGINPDRYSAHKNLGIGLEGIGRYAEAAKCYIIACRLNSKDQRALHHLESLVASHPEVKRIVRNLRAQIDVCRKAAGVVWQ